MKKAYLILVILGLISFACQNDSKPNMSDLAKMEVPSKFRDGVFIHISEGYNNPLKVLKALNLAVKMTDSYDVALYFDINGVDLLTKSSENIQLDNFLSLHESLDKLIEKHVLIIACPMCMISKAIEADQLRDGVVVAEKEKFFTFTKGRILSLDY